MLGRYELPWKVLEGNVFTTEREDSTQLNLKQNASPPQNNHSLYILDLFFHSPSILYRLLTADKKFTSHK